MYFLLLLALVGLCIPAKAVLVNIPDANFRAKLQTLYPACFVGVQMETTCASIIGASTLNMDNSNIANLSGVEYFTNLQALYCSFNQLTVLPTLPSSLTLLTCFQNQLTSLPALPSGLTSLECGPNLLTSLPTLPNTLTFLDCGYNRLTSLPTLPNTLITLLCNNNILSILPSLPSSMTQLIVINNQLTSLPTLPINLIDLRCQSNFLDFADLESISYKPTTYAATPQSYKILPVSQSLLSGATLTISGAIGGTFNIYKWYKDNVLISGATSATYTKANATTADAGVYKCEVTSTYVGLGTTTGVTIISSNVTITITENPTTSIDNSLSNLVKISPNPSNDDFSVDFSALSVVKSLVCVYDAQGKTIFSSNVNNNVIDISLKNVPNGIYLLQISTEKGNILKRIVKAD